MLLDNKFSAFSKAGCKFTKLYSKTDKKREIKIIITLQFYPKTISNWTFIAFLCNYFDYRLKQFCCHCVFRCSVIRQGAIKGKMTLQIQTTNPTNLHESDWQIAPHGTRRTQNILDEWSGGGNADSIPTVTNKGFSFQHILLTHKTLSFKTHPPRLFVLSHPTLASPNQAAAIKNSRKWKSRALRRGFSDDWFWILEGNA